MLCIQVAGLNIEIFKRKHYSVVDEWIIYILKYIKIIQKRVVEYIILNKAKINQELSKHESITITASPVNQSRVSLTSSAASQSEGADPKQARRGSILANMATLRAEYGDWKYDRF